MRIMFAVKSKEIETLGVMYLAAVAKQHGAEAKIVTFDEVVASSHIWQADYVGFSVMTGDQQRVMSLARSIKWFWPSGKVPPKVIVGGPHPTFFMNDFFPKYDITGGAVDMAVTGEAENFMAGLCGDASPYLGLDNIPWPAREDFPGHSIRDFITSRGCPYSCSYCYNQKWHELAPEPVRVRIRDPFDVIAEIKDVEARYKQRFNYFQDSCFATKMSWLKDFAPEYKKQIALPYHCHLRPNMVSEERVALLSGSGCFSVRIALESASTRLRALLNRKNVDMRETLEAAKLFRQYGIKLMIQNMIGLPTSTISDDLETLEFNIRCKPAYGWVSIFSPYPGTELGDKCKEKGWYSGDYSEITDCFFDTSVLNFTPEHIEQLECLQKIFALCVESDYLPNAAELTHQNFPKLVHKILRRTGDHRLYAGVI